MTKEDLSNALSLTCVENYFLSYFKDFFDIRKLYVESYVSISDIMENFLVNGVSYETYPINKVQETSEKLGLTRHEFSSEINLEDSSLNLIRVNNRFFENSKRLPWRKDHFIAIEKNTERLVYFNNYPLSLGEITLKRINEVYDNASIKFFLGEKRELKKKLEIDQFEKIRVGKSEMFKFTDENVLTNENILKFRSALMVMKTLRKRLVKWLEFLAEEGKFLIDTQFNELACLLLDKIQSLFIISEVQIARRKIDFEFLQTQFDDLARLDKNLTKEIERRRIENENI